eukprot:TRINITY_DN62814_c0_g1_i1.p1 TRINITY_DN62814_c0_g1~~TRINITY_DN62814_c0_g1_i1.p1  ORF type:complete len:836 (+),score=124.15 TRINITY_DN62814_c0_g1_i1:53-2560(+)
MAVDESSCDAKNSTISTNATGSTASPFEPAVDDPVFPNQEQGFKAAFRAQRQAYVTVANAGGAVCHLRRDSLAPFGGALSIDDVDARSFADLDRNSHGTNFTRLDSHGDAPVGHSFPGAVGPRPWRSQSDSDAGGAAFAQVVEPLEGAFPMTGRKHSSQIDMSRSDDEPKRVGLFAALRSAHGGSDRTKVGLVSHCQTPSASLSGLPGTENPETSMQAGYNHTIAFVARRVYRRLRGGIQLQHVSPVLARFDENNFATEDNGERLHSYRPPETRRQPETQQGVCSTVCKRLCIFGRRSPKPRRPATEPTVAVEQIYGFLHGFATWCGLRADLVVVALVYMDRLLDECCDADGNRAGGVLTAASWRPMLIVTLLLASKVWEDWCVCNSEVAQFTGITSRSLLDLELQTMDMLGWDVSITANVFAPYFWAVKTFLQEGRDDITGSMTRSLPDHLRDQLEKEAKQMPVQLATGRGLKKSPSYLSDFEHWATSCVLVDTVEDRYHILETLGRGNCGEVKLAHKIGDLTKETFAVKILDKCNAQLFRTFVTSGLFTSLQHPNIVRFVEFLVMSATPSSEVYYSTVMESLVGPDLFDWISLRQQAVASGTVTWFSESEVADMARHMLSGLKYLHEHSPYVVHRDVKPENLRWSSWCSAALLKLVDFELAFCESHEDPVDISQHRTWMYTAPEVFEPQPVIVRPSQDMYSAGVVLFLVLSGGHFPHAAEGPGSKGAANAPWHLLPEVTVDVARSLLHSDPSKRPTADEVLQLAWLQRGLPAAPLHVCSPTSKLCDHAKAEVANLVKGSESKTITEIRRRSKDVAESFSSPLMSATGGKSLRK